MYFAFIVSNICPSVQNVIIHPIIWNNSLKSPCVSTSRILPCVGWSTSHKEMPRNTFTCIYCGETKQYPRGWQPTGWRAAEIPKDIGGVRVG